MTKITLLTLTALLLMPLHVVHASDEVNPVQLRVNDIDAPIGLDASDVASLRFGWLIVLVTSPST